MNNLTGFIPKSVKEEQKAKEKVAILQMALIKLNNYVQSTDNDLEFIKEVIAEYTKLIIKNTSGVK